MKYVWYFLAFLAFDSIATAQSVSSQYSEKLKKYVVDRIDTREGGESIAQLINAKANDKLKVDASSVRCLGYASWEGNAKAVGVCLIDASRSGEDSDFAGRFAVVVSDDTEHPNEHRRIEVHLVSYRI